MVVKARTFVVTIFVFIFVLLTNHFNLSSSNQVNLHLSNEVDLWSSNYLRKGSHSSQRAVTVVH